MIIQSQTHAYLGDQPIPFFPNFSNNEVSLEIVKELIQSCNHDLNLFSKYVVRILNMILDTRDTSLLDKACGTVCLMTWR